MANLLFPLSAHAPEELAATAGKLADWLEDAGADVPLADLAHTLVQGSLLLRERAVAVASSHEQLVSRLRSLTTLEPGTGTTLGSATTNGEPVWVFSGHGSQWPGMGRALLRHEPVFAERIGAIEPIMAAEAGFSVRAAISGEQPVTGVERVQPALFAMQVALAETWRAYGPEPAAVIGHSMGEVAAAVVAGALTLAQGVAVICRRSRLMARLAGDGAMAMVALPGDAVRAELDEAGIADVVVAAYSSPVACVVAGAPGRVADLVAGWAARELMARAVTVEVASHSPQVAPIIDELTASLAGLAPAEPAIPCYTTVLDDPRERARFDAEYWSDNLRRPVRFTGAVSAAIADGHALFVEISPHPLLAYPLRENVTAARRDAVILSTMRRGGDAALRLRTQLGALHCAGARLDWSRLAPPGRRIDPAFPLPLPGF
ncbi:acyltransferase domain-containing protein [Amycolatopsis anabasis]|uniref:acyltransferase domain-containing protein n=1 Tax=Amycolatopsis anabasis TaxID=1840409 RepID=UPI00131C793A|nr:acyltransferase domain-containing protein [Amycolatopsis anabasis]